MNSSAVIVIILAVLVSVAGVLAPATNELVGGGGGQLVLFYTTWCGYCKQIKPVWGKLEKEFGSTLVSIDADKDSQMKRAYGVQGYPSIYWCPKGVKDSSQIAEPYTGGRTVEDIRNFLKSKM